MAARTRVTAAALTCVTLFAAAAPGRGDDLLDRVLATVEGRVITLSDVRTAVQFGLVATDSPADVMAASLDRLINRLVILRPQTRPCRLRDSTRRRSRSGRATTCALRSIFANGSRAPPSRARRTSRATSAGTRPTCGAPDARSTIRRFSGWRGSVSRPSGRRRWWPSGCRGCGPAPEWARRHRCRTDG